MIFDSHVCIITTAHPLDDVRVNTKIADSLVKAGSEVSWVGPARAFFAGDDYRASDIEYHVFKSRAGKVERLAGPMKARNLSRHLRDVDWIYTPDPDAAALGVSLKKRLSAKLIFDIHEEFHGGLLSRWLGGREVPLIQGVVRRAIAEICKRCDIVIGVGEQVLSPYTQGHPNVLTIRNGAPRWFAENPKDPQSVTGPVRFFHGKGLESNGTPTLLSALPKVTFPARLLLFPSPGPVDAAPYMPDLLNIAQNNGIADKLDLYPGTKHELMPRLMDSCQVGLISYGRELGVASLPNRLFEYMARGMAVVAPSYSEEIVSIIKSERIGIDVDFEDVEAVAAGMDWMSAHPEEVRAMGARAREAFLNRYCWEAEFEQLLNRISTLSEQS